MYPEVLQYVNDAFSSNVTGYNHRSHFVIDIVESLKEQLFKKLNVPKDYEMGFLCSATEAWGSIAQSFRNFEILNIYNGTFGEKWAQINVNVNPKAKALRFDLNHKFEVEEIHSTSGSLICVCQNETSNGTQVSNETLQQIRNFSPESLILVDATSSMGGISLDFKNADIWFASVQKCFGLPAGLCVVLMSPRVKEYFSRIDQSTYNNIVALYSKSRLAQTIHTPNVLNIYLLSRLMDVLPEISHIDTVTQERAVAWRSFIKDKDLELLSNNPMVLSDTVLAIKYKESLITSLLDDVNNYGFILGKGYGEFANNSIRIANFPALSDIHIQSLRDVLNKLI